MPPLSPVSPARATSVPREPCPPAWGWAGSRGVLYLVSMTNFTASDLGQLGWWVMQDPVLNC